MVCLSGLSHLNYIHVGLSDSLPLTRWVFNGFSSQPGIFAASFPWKLLSRLSNFFLFQTLPLSADVAGLITRYDRMVNSIPYILTVLTSMVFDSDGMNANADEHASKPPNARLKGSKKGKQLNKAPPKKTVDSKVLDDFSIHIPISRQDKDKEISTILSTAKSMLEVGVLCSMFLLYFSSHCAVLFGTSSLAGSLRCHTLSVRSVPRREKVKSDQHAPFSV